MQILGRWPVRCEEADWEATSDRSRQSGNEGGLRSRAEYGDQALVGRRAKRRAAGH